MKGLLLGQQVVLDMCEDYIRKYYVYPDKLPCTKLMKMLWGKQIYTRTG
jgi:hypothetical protein